MKIWLIAVPAVLLVAFILIWRRSPKVRHFFRKMWVRFETRDFRPMAEQRDWFLWLTSAFFVLGLIGAGVKIWQSGAGGVIFDVAALLIAVFGFFFAVYGIRGVLERPRDLDEILIRTAQLINRYKRDNYVAVMLCEYPAWGSLSLKKTPAYNDYVNAFRHFLDEHLQTKVILVAPDDNEMKKRILIYAKDYGRNESQETTAEHANTSLMGILDAAAANSRFKRHNRSNDVPRYQMLLIGKEIPDDKGNDKDFLPLEAIVWYAPRNSDVPAGNADIDYATKRGNWDWKEKEVPVLAWQTTAPYILRELYDCALFYADRNNRLTYRQFLTA